jgi:hypothetical protein
MTSQPGVVLSRRFFLRGVGGATLALPLLPSLLTSREAAAQAANPNNRCFVALLTVHGGVWAQNMYPADASLTTSQLYATAGFNVRSGALVPTLNNGTTSVSPVLSAPSTVLTPALVNKMNVLRGLDIPYQFSHHDGRGALGNIVLNDGTTSTLPANPQRRSIDQVMAWSPNFYTSTQGIRERSVHLHTISYPSYGYSNPTVGASSGIQGIGRTANDSMQLFNDLFPMPSTTPTPTRPLLVDLVLQDYQRLRNGSKRMSAADKQRLDDYMQRIYELQRRVSTTTAPACNNITQPAMSNSSISGAPDANGSDPKAPYDGSTQSPALQTQYYQLYNDVLAAALHCGATRVVVMIADSLMSDFGTVPAGLWHDNVAHQCDGATGQQNMTQAQSAFFSGVMVDLAQKLDAADEGNGSTTLDRSLVMWTQEYGNLIHVPYAIPVVTFGSASGGLKTGNYCDYRNLNKLKNPNATGESKNQAPGLTWHQMLGTCLQAVGVQRSEYQESNHNGYGVRVADPASDWPQATWDAAGDMLPFLS